MNVIGREMEAWGQYLHKSWVTGVAGGGGGQARQRKNERSKISKGVRVIIGEKRVLNSLTW